MEVQAKLDEWKRQLLDLSKRNRLLHFKETKRQTIQVAAPDSSTLFKRIAVSGRPLTVIGVDRQSLFDFDAQAEESVEPPSVPRVVEPKVGEVRFEGSPDRVAGALYTLRSRGHTEMEERGVGVLFMAFGFLNWFESDQSDYEMRSPIVLVPVNLERKAALDPYKIVPRDDDVVLNPTLTKVLKDQFNIDLPDLPESEVWELSDYLEAVRKKVKRQQRWTVDDQAYLSVFSFLKLSMYRDLEAGAKVAAANPVLGALAGDLSALAARQSEVREIEPEDLDAKVDPALSFQVLDADSSQQQAIELVKAGSNLVLQGPPGTGKSQTIANMIAELLGAGRTVLFVSEKAAALEVVHRRLSAVGLADAVLPLHSYRANKREVLSELERVYLKGPQGVGVASSYSYTRLKQRRDALNEYVREIHQRREPLGVSVFTAQGHIAMLEDVPDVPFGVPKIAELTPERLERLRDSFARLSGSHQAIRSLEDNPWRGCTLDGQSIEVRRTAVESLEHHEAIFVEFANEIETMAVRLGLDRVDLSFGRAEWLSRVALALAEGPDFLPSWLEPGRLPQLRSLATAAYGQTAALLNERGLLEANFSRSFLAYDLEGLQARLANEYQSAFSRLGSAWRRESKELASCTVDGKRAKFSDLVSLTPVALNVRQREAWIQAQTPSLAQAFEAWFAGEGTDWASLIAALDWAEKIAAAFAENTPSSFIAHAQDVLSDRQSMRDRLATLQASATKASESVGGMQRWFDADAPSAAILRDTETRQATDLITLARSLSGTIDMLEDWTRLACALEECREAGVSESLGPITKSDLQAELYERAVEKRALSLWVDHWIGATAALKDFDASAHEHLVREFRRFDGDLKNAARARLVAATASRRPHPSASALNLSSSQPSILMKEAKKKRRQKPLRRLFSEIPELLASIKPCMMMSPLSVSQFLALDGVRFDVVIFDEASQVKPEDAVGAIMRGSQLVVVGDSKQLPPTSFFDVSVGDEFEEDEYYDDDTGAFESILDLCGTVGIPEKMLRWHYRSRREGLIAFSNNFLYDNRLVTFPSPGFDGVGTGVEFVFLPDGIYDRSRSRTNASEVERIVEIVKHHAVETPEATLGVVAFSQAQMAAIDTALWRARAEDPAIESFFANSHDEPFFVKNLENVQGDERDVIVFSVGYGKDAAGRLAMNFGPLNNRGGERRLNVAVTRARERVILVSSIRGADIELGRTQAEGVRLLKHYLDYAERGVSALDAICELDPDAEFGSPFEEQVARTLEGMGYTVHKQVGCSGYRIDLAVVHPDRPGQYAIGIECDGASYHSAATARERDRLREQVLRDLGWTLHRVWSTDWFRARSREVTRLKQAVDAAIMAPAPRRTSTPVRLRTSSAQSDEGEALSDVETADSLQTVDFQEQLADPYRPHSPTFQRSDFYESPQRVRAVAVEVVNAEGPIHIDDLVRTVGSAWGFERAGHRIRSAVESAVRSAAAAGQLEVRGDFVWTAGTTTPPVRRNVVGGPSRAADSIAPEEVAEAAALVLHHQLKLSEDDLIVATARILGFDHCGSKVRSRVAEGVKLLVASGRATRANGSIALQAQ